MGHFVAVGGHAVALGGQTVTVAGQVVAATCMIVTTGTVVSPAFLASSSAAPKARTTLSKCSRT
jgi:hypothetical protein